MTQIREKVTDEMLGTRSGYGIMTPRVARIH
jgi:hypothetical protein